MATTAVKTVKKQAQKAKKYVKSGGLEKTSARAVDTVKSNPNTALIIGGLVIGGYFLSRLGKGISDVGSAIGNVTENIVGSEQPKTDGTKPASTLNRAQASQIAETLYAAMASAGTEEGRIFNALRGVTYNDWVMIKNAFGQRRYNSWTGEGSFAPFPLANLAEWINAELEPDELATLAQIAPEVFKTSK